MDIERFVAVRAERWRRLQRLLDETETLPERALGAARIQEIVRLYRRVCTDLNEARSYTANPELLGRLDDLAGRGYRFVYRGAGGRAGFWHGVTRLLLVEVPAALGRRRMSVMAAASALLLGTLTGFVAVLANPANGPRLVPPQLYAERPRDRVEWIETSEERVDSVAKAGDFGAYLYTHNIQVSFLAFSLGAVSLVGGLWLLFYNGVILGAVMAAYVADGVHVFFFAWVGPHGALELPAIVLAGGAGLAMGRALLLPGERLRGEALRETFPDAARMLAASALVLVVAGVIEGSLSQFSSRSFSYAFKISLAVALFAVLVAWLARAGSAPRATT